MMGSEFVIYLYNLTFLGDTKKFMPRVSTNDFEVEDQTNRNFRSDVIYKIAY